MYVETSSQKIDLLGICHFNFCPASEPLYCERMFHFLNFGDE